MKLYKWGKNQNRIQPNNLRTKYSYATTKYYGTYKEINFKGQKEQRTISQSATLNAY